MWELAIILAIWFCRRLTYQHIIFVLENRKPRLQGKTFMLGHVLLTMCTETSSYLLCSNGDQVKRQTPWCLISTLDRQQNQDFAHNGVLLCSVIQPWLLQTVPSLRLPCQYRESRHYSIKNVVALCLRRLSHGSLAERLPGKYNIKKKQMVLLWTFDEKNDVSRTQ